jgi:hypothetical protein
LVSLREDKHCSIICPALWVLLHAVVRGVGLAGMYLGKIVSCEGKCGWASPSVNVHLYLGELATCLNSNITRLCRDAPSLTPVCMVVIRAGQEPPDDPAG